MHVKPIRTLSAAEQVAEHIRKHITQQRMRGDMPGIHQLAADLMVNHKTVKTALEILQREGLLVTQGQGKPRRIQVSGLTKKRTMRVAILLYDEDDKKVDRILASVQRLIEAGHEPFYVKKSLVDLKMNVGSVAKLVKQTEADAWIVVAGSVDVLEWFAEQDFPAFALYGRVANVSIASAIPYTVPAVNEVIKHLITLGHRRLVLIAREERRKPKPGFTEQMFLEELESHGISTGAYNLPDWEETPAGLHALFESLFQHTPPTALLTQGSEITTAAILYCANKGIKVPQQVSIVSMDADRAFAWCHPSVSHIGFDNEVLVKRIVTWANQISRGKIDERMTTTDAEFIRGGTISVPPKS